MCAAIVSIHTRISFEIREKEKINEIRKISYNEEKVLINVDKKVITFEVE